MLSNFVFQSLRMNAPSHSARTRISTKCPDSTSTPRAQPSETLAWMQETPSSRLVSGCPSFFFSRRHDGAFRYPLQSARGFPASLPPSVVQPSPQCSGNWHSDDLFHNALRHAPLGGRLCSPQGPPFTPHTLNQRLFWYWNTRTCIAVSCGATWYPNEIGRDVSRCHPTPSTKAWNRLSIVLVLTVHREEMENSVQDATRCSVQFVHSPSGNESLVLSPPRTCNAWISLPQALRLWREKKRC